MGLEMEQLPAAGLLSLGAQEDRLQLRPYKVMRNEQFLIQVEDGKTE